MNHTNRNTTIQRMFLCYLQFRQSVRNLKFQSMKVIVYDIQDCITAIIFHIEPPSGFNFSHQQSPLYLQPEFSSCKYDGSETKSEKVCSQNLYWAGKIFFSPLLLTFYYSYSVGNVLCLCCYHY